MATNCIISEVTLFHFLISIVLDKGIMTFMLSQFSPIKLKDVRKTHQRFYPNTLFNYTFYIRVILSHTYTQMMYINK
jgi:hypothetical protein